MNQAYSFLVLDQECSEATDWVVSRLESAGLQVMRTFDLQAARSAHAGCSCPHHGTDRCDCQMVVLLIYGANGQLISLMAHGYDGKTWFSLVDTPQQRADVQLEQMIRHVLTPQMFVR